MTLLLFVFATTAAICYRGTYKRSREWILLADSFLQRPIALCYSLQAAAGWRNQIGLNHWKARNRVHVVPTGVAASFRGGRGDFLPSHK